MTNDHALFKFSITCKTDDIAVLYCLRALCQFVEEHPKRQIGWGGTGKHTWEDNNRQIVLRFTNPKYRQRFINEAKRLFGNLWSISCTNDNNPATPRRNR